MTYNFFATISRMKYIERWALMRNSRPENLSEHATEVAMIVHALCTIGNVRYGKHLDAEKAALIGVFHDASEIITGDMPTPVKYYNDEIRNAYKAVEAIAEDELLAKLPEDLRPVYEEIFRGDQSENEQYMRKLLKAADRISALIKCIEEENAGNREFRSARESIEESIEAMAFDYLEVADFMVEFLPSYGNTLDELQSDKGPISEKSGEEYSMHDTMSQEEESNALGAMFESMAQSAFSMMDHMVDEESDGEENADQSFYSDLYGRFDQ